MSNISLNLRRVIKAGQEKVFDAWTDPAQLVQWWGPATTTCPEAEVDLRVGGVIRIANKIDDGSIVWINGVFEEVTRPSRLIYSWLMGDSMPAPTRVTVEFKPHPEGTELTLTHDNFATQEVCDHHERGWHGCIDGLEALLTA